MLLLVVVTVPLRSRVLLVRQYVLRLLSLGGCCAWRPGPPPPPSTLVLLLLPSWPFLVLLILCWREKWSEPPVVHTNIYTDFTSECLGFEYFRLKRFQRERGSFQS